MFNIGSYVLDYKNIVIFYKALRVLRRHDFESKINRSFVSYAYVLFHYVCISPDRPPNVYKILGFEFKLSILCISGPIRPTYSIKKN